MTIAVSLFLKRTTTHISHAWLCYLPFMLAGLLLPFAFAPFHCAGLSVLSLALFYYLLFRLPRCTAFKAGLCFGLGYFGFGISWIFVSIHDYGHLNDVLSALITLLFIIYLSLYTGLMSAVFKTLCARTAFSYRNAFLFAALWVVSEWARATLFSGFPWLLLGYSQFDSPLRYLIPIIGLYGVGFLTALISGLVLMALTETQALKKALAMSRIVLLMLCPLLLKHTQWQTPSGEPLSVGVVQANLSMRDKWDEALFWQLVMHYQQETDKLMGTQVIVLPESAFPVPSSYLSDLFHTLGTKAKQQGSAILLGVPEQAAQADKFYNALITLGKAKGQYFKQHLVPFGEYTPRPFLKFMHMLGIPDADLVAGRLPKQLVRVQKHPVATLICYELAYGDLLRQQLPLAQWLISISDDGWFGHSLAMYQHIQMAQTRSLQTARDQVVANNDGLSSVMDKDGRIVETLPAHQAGLLKAHIQPRNGATPWVVMGDAPALLIAGLIVFTHLIRRLKNHKELRQVLAARLKKRYPYSTI